MALADILGHDRLLERLSRALAQASLPPSLIFSGEAGIGKRTIALAVAQAANCPTPLLDLTRPGVDGTSAALALDACGVCRSCQRIARALTEWPSPHPDITVLAPDEKGSIKVDPTRDMLASVAYRPFEARRRFVVIDQADTLEEGAQNALLKMLEEPPASTVFVLVTSRPDALLATVRSRCARLRFRPLTPNELVVGLTARGVPADRARDVCDQAGGSLALALALAAEDDTVAARKAALELLQGVARARDPKDRLGRAKDLLHGKPTSVTERDWIAPRLRALGSLVRDLALIAEGADTRALTNVDLESALAPLARALDTERVGLAFAAVELAVRHLDSNANAKLVADSLALRL